MKSETILVMDNGGGSVKAGLYSQKEPAIYANMTARVSKSMQYLISNQIYECRDGSSLNFIRPCDRGYLNNWQCEIEVWSHILGSEGFKAVNNADTALVLTEPPVNPTTLQNDTNEVVFEYFGFKEYTRRPSEWFSMYEFCHDPDWNRDQFNSCVIVNSGFSFTHAVPFVNRSCKHSAMKRLNIGGKLLTNYLKELVSYRQWNMMDEFLLMNQVKESLCYVSQDFLTELQNARLAGKPISLGSSERRPIALDHQGALLKKQFVLPDYHTVMKGYVKPDHEAPDPKEQVLAMETERFCVPELLFNPGDIGIDQAGVAECTWQALQTLDKVELGLAAANIILTGGNANIPGYKERFERELRPFVPDLYEVRVHQPERPELYAWQGAARWARDCQAHPAMREANFVTRAEYLECGHEHVNEKFSRVC